MHDGTMEWPFWCRFPRGDAPLSGGEWLAGVFATRIRSAPCERARSDDAAMGAAGARQPCTTAIGVLPCSGIRAARGRWHWRTEQRRRSATAREGYDYYNNHDHDHDHDLHSSGSAYEPAISIGRVPSASTKDLCGSQGRQCAEGGLLAREVFGPRRVSLSERLHQVLHRSREWPRQASVFKGQAESTTCRTITVGCGQLPIRRIPRRRRS
mmetsp:Transcript_116202/g.182796  ORF Transcript_116202/g.182796 Transcript_116202/m.182796 type:complete len:211 (-) Transcript_116202:678-1310(-)